MKNKMISIAKTCADAGAFRAGQLFCADQRKTTPKYVHFRRKISSCGQDSQALQCNIWGWTNRSKRSLLLDGKTSEDKHTART